MHRDTIANLAAIAAGLVLLKTVGMDGAIVALCWGLIGIFALSLIGEFIIIPWRESRKKEEKK